MNSSRVNKDDRVVSGFGEEWQRFTQIEIPDEEREEIFNNYFAVFPWEALPADAVGADFGCGSGRWAYLVAPRVAMLHLVDASEKALEVARKAMAPFSNVEFHHSSIEASPIPASSLDFAYSLGVMHHMPDTQAALEVVVSKLKPGAPLLIYLYYAMENQPAWYRVIWQISNILRKSISRAPTKMRFFICDAIALIVYWPLARAARLLEFIKILPKSWPLAWYRDKEFYMMRTDSLDRFGTSLEQRFRKDEIESMLEQAGMENIIFSPRAPFWCAVSTKVA